MEISDDQKDPEAAFHRANSLLGQNRFDEALHELEKASQYFEMAADPGNAALYSNVRGSFLASRQRNEEALAEFLRAERLDPDECHWRLETAHHLLRIGQPEAARTKSLEILARGDQGPEIVHLAYSYLGLAELALGQESQALGAFRSSIAEDILGSLSPSNYFPRLASELLGRGLEVSLARDFLVRAHPGEEAE